MSRLRRNIASHPAAAARTFGRGLEAKLFDLAIQRAAADVEHLRRFELVPPHGFEHTDDVSLLGVTQRRQARGRRFFFQAAGVLVHELEIGSTNDTARCRQCRTRHRALELANNGTLFLDEVGDLSLVAQAKLLRVLEERRFERLGGNRSIQVDFRLISATNRPLDLFVRENRFREDLYYRINAFSIRLPSLKERVVDIPVLANRFLARYCAANGLPLDAKQFSTEAQDLLTTYHWPGNIRELESTVSRAALSAPGRSIRSADLEFMHEHTGSMDEEAPTSRLPTLRHAEKAHISRVLEAVAWNKLEAAKVLDISRGTLYRKIEEFGLEPAAEGPGRGRRVRRDVPA